MTSKSATIRISSADCDRRLPATADPGCEARRLLRAYADASDVTVSIELPDDRGTLLVALEAGSAFVGLDAADGVYQYVADEAAEGKQQFIIGGQRTAIDSRYVLPVTTAIELLTSWTAGSDPLAAPAWERQ
jgi:hypothetical protein